MTPAKEAAHTGTATGGLDVRLRGSRLSFILKELFSNSAHFPLANILLEMLLEGPAMFVRKADFYILISASLLQSIALGSQTHRGRPIPLAGNLIGPAVYSIFEFLVEGPEFLSAPNHLAYWVFSLVIGIMQKFGSRPQGLAKAVFVIGENIVRTMILFFMYWIFEARDNALYTTVGGFMSDPSHIFIFLSLLFTGVMVGVSNYRAGSYLDTLTGTAERLGVFSRWFLGSRLLDRAVDDISTLFISRKNRVLLFMDIRGFTAWSELEPPEKVVGLLNGCFEKSEPVWTRHHAIKAKFTADELMLVFEKPESALSTAIELSGIINEYLGKYGLSVGIGINGGPVVEGLLGSGGLKIYDIIGDPVNTAKRICDNASGGEILISASLKQSLPDGAAAETKSITVKGKKAPVEVVRINAANYTKDN